MASMKKMGSAMMGLVMLAISAGEALAQRQQVVDMRTDDAITIPAPLLQETAINPMQADMAKAIKEAKADPRNAISKAEYAAAKLGFGGKAMSQKELTNMIAATVAVTEGIEKKMGPEGAKNAPDYERGMEALKTLIQFNGGNVILSNVSGNYYIKTKPLNEPSAAKKEAGMQKVMRGAGLNERAMGVKAPVPGF